MKLKLTQPPRMTAVDKKTGKEHNVIRYECGHLDKNKDGVRYVLQDAHNGRPAVREPHEVEVMIELPDEVIRSIKTMLMCQHMQDILKRNVV